MPLIAMASDQKIISGQSAASSSQKIFYSYSEVGLKSILVIDLPLTLFPMGGGRGISQLIQTISFQTRIELHG